MDRLRGEHLALDGDGVFLQVDRYDVEEAARCVKLTEELSGLSIPAAAYERERPQASTGGADTGCT